MSVDVRVPEDRGDEGFELFEEGDEAAPDGAKISAKSGRLGDDIFGFDEKRTEELHALKRAIHPNARYSALLRRYEEQNIVVGVGGRKHHDFIMLLMQKVCQRDILSGCRTTFLLA
jgi:hypothetical protein